VLPDDLYHQAKTRAAAQRRKLKDLIADGLRAVLATKADGGKPTDAQESKRVLDALDDILRCPPSDPGRTASLQSSARKLRLDGWSRQDAGE